MKTILTLIFTTFITVTLLAQNETDALRYSLSSHGGTSRFTSMSGAYGAIGADFSSLSQNPAGIGLYRKSELSFTPLISSTSTESAFGGKSNSDYRTAFSIANAGYVMSFNLNNTEGSALKQLQFGFGINRIASFNSRILVEGYNDENSLMTQYRNDADLAGTDRNNLSDFGAGLAYDVNLLYLDTNNVWQVDMPYGGLSQSKSVETHGGITETVFSTGANISEKLFVGMTLGFPHINYEEESRYTEKDADESSPFLKSFDRTEYLYTRGTGINFKLGFILKPIEFVRIGGAFHTPTAFYNMHDSYGATMTSYFDQPPLSNSNQTRFEESAPDGLYDYEIRTPLKAMGSLAFVIGKYGIVSADYEYIDYTTARLRASDYNFSEENSAIKDYFQSASNIRIGTEWKAGIFALRGGYNMYGSPYKGADKMGARTGYSFGFGIREKAYFVDFSFSHTSTELDYYIYNISPVAKNKVNSNAYSVTLGFRM